MSDKKFGIHLIYKFFWALRAIFLKPAFGRFSFPGYIGKPTFLLGISKVYISSRVRIFPGLRLEAHGDGIITINENVAIGHNLHITCSKNIIIGRGTVISSNVMITDMDHNYDDIRLPILSQGVLSKETIIGVNNFIGTGACIQAGTVLGEHCIVGANAVVRGTFPSFCVIAGIPAKIVRRYDPESKLWQKV